MTQREKLERAYRRQIRNLEWEVSFLRDLLWTETQGKHEVFQIPVQTPRKEEKTGETDNDTFLKNLFAWSE